MMRASQAKPNPDETGARADARNGERPPTHDIIVVGASAGGVEALIALVGNLPPKLPAALFVVLHMSANAPSYLAQILARAGPLPARTAEDGEAIRFGQICVARPDHHLLVAHGVVRVARGPRENRSRPAVDPLFRTAALTYGPRVVGVILSGALNDGTAGLLAIKRRGGMALVQDPTTALFPGMPQSACAYVDVDYCLPTFELASKVVELAHASIDVRKGVLPVPPEMELEAKIAGLDSSVLEHSPSVGRLTSLTCPECHGPMWEIQDGSLLRFRCRVGHAYTAESMVEGQSESVENSLWMALNSLEESALLYTTLADAARTHGDREPAEVYDRKASMLLGRAQTIREMVAPEELAEPGAEAATAAGAGGE